jgi:hypothetical protein
MKLWVGKTENPRILARIEVFRNHTSTLVLISIKLIIA